MERFSVAVWLLVGTMLAGQAWPADKPAPEFVIKEGSGLTRLSLGMTSEQALRAMGEPDQDLYGFIFVHQLPDGVMLSYRISDDRVVAINIKPGGKSSRYVTRRGAKFGMLRKEVILLYGAPESEAVNKIFYAAQGISFFFTNGVLYEIGIMPVNKLPPLED